MTRKSRRELEREVDDLAPDDDSNPPLVFKLTAIPSGKLEDSPHPELTVEARPDSSRHDRLAVAVPNLLPAPYADESMLFIESCGNHVTETWENVGSDGLVSACELWDALSDEDLRREYEIRQENGDPIPELLET